MKVCVKKEGEGRRGEEERKKEKREREREGYNLRINSWVALAQFNKHRAVVDDDLLWAWQLQNVPKEHFSDDVLGWDLVPLKGTFSKGCQGNSTV